MSNKPNIIFILIDDMGWKDLTCYDSSFYETPNIDKLAKHGIKFTNAYAACPVCSPTRASIMTGKYPARLGLTHYIGGHEKGKLLEAPYIDHLPLSEVSLVKTLKQNGYQTWHVGKWHLGSKPYYPKQHGFDVNIGGCSRGGPGRDGYFSPYNIENLENGPDGEYLIDRITNEAINLIKKNKKEKPFYLNLWHYAVHMPIQAKEELIEKYRKKRLEMGLNKVKEIEIGENFPCEHKKNQHVERRLVQSSAKYAAMIETLDTNIGKLLDTLDEEGYSENTMVIFTSDNGGLSTSETSPTCNYPLNEGKGWMYEGGVREPLIIKWPNHIKANSQCFVPVTSTDFYPTILSATNIPLIPEQHMDGVDLLPLLKGGDKINRDAIYWHFPHYGNQGGTPGSSIRYGDYKLIEFYEDNRIELYNLTEDISETTNIAKDKPVLVNKMHEMLINWRLSVEAKEPIQNPKYS